jgi:hypothetical protein
MIVLGVGMGFLMQTTMLIAQNSVEQRDMGVASSTSTFFRNIGGSFGVSIFGAIFANQLRHELTDRFGSAGSGQFSESAGNIDPAMLGQLDPQVKTGLLESISGATSSIFLWATVAAVVVPILAWFIKEVPLRGGPGQPVGGGRAAEDATPEPALAP